MSSIQPRPRCTPDHCWLQLQPGERWLEKIPIVSTDSEKVKMAKDILNASPHPCHENYIPRELKYDRVKPCINEYIDVLKQYEEILRSSKHVDVVARVAKFKRERRFFTINRNLEECRPVYEDVDGWVIPWIWKYSYHMNKYKSNVIAIELVAAGLFSFAFFNVVTASLLTFTAIPLSVYIYKTQALSVKDWNRSNGFIAEGINDKGQNLKEPKK